MLGFPCHALYYERHDWPFVAYRGIFTFRHELMRGDTDAIWSRFVKFRRHEVSRSGLPFRYDQIRSDRIVPTVHDWVPILQDYQDRGFRSGTCRYVRICSDTIIRNRCPLLRSDTTVFVMTFTIGIENDHDLSYD